ncbi:MAG: winged-helix domain-containing protein [Candidatus Bathyarchaeia archaeon]
MLHGQVDRKLIEILKVLSKENTPTCAKLLLKSLEREYGLDERTVRYYLRILDERG